MKKYHKYFIAFSLFLSFSIFSFNRLLAAGIHPTFDITVKNIAPSPGINGQDSILTFEIWLQQTNQGQPNVNDFEYGAGQFTFRYNKLIHSPGGNLVLGLVPAGCNLPPNLRPPTFQVDSVNGYLKTSGNLPNPSANYFINGTYPGTKILTLKIVTNKKTFNIVPLNLRFKLGAAPTTILAYLLPYPPSADSVLFPPQQVVQLRDTVVNHYSVEDTSSYGGFSLITPGYNSSTANKFINFSWHKADNVKSYKLQIATDLNFNNIVFSDSTLIDTSETVSILNPDVTYYWKVYAVRDSSHHSNSLTWIFNSVSAQVALNSPQNNATSLQLPVTFSWFKTYQLTSLKPGSFVHENTDNIIFNKNLKSDISSSGFDFISHDTYKLEIAIDQNFSNIVFSDSAITDSFKTVSNLNLNTTYYWKVNSNNDSVFTLSSLARIFRTADTTTGSGILYTMDINLTGLHAVPPTPSSGVGGLQGTYDPATRTLYFELAFTGLTWPTTGAHFHGPASVSTLAPVQIAFLGFPNGVTSGAYSNTYILNADQESQLLAGLWYVDIHTTNFPDGEIRGQLNEGTLPVELSAFTSIIFKDKVTLNWSTSGETNNAGFDIERSLLKGEWTKVGNVGGNGNSTVTKNYSFNERVNSGKYNYRLKQIDFNGNFEYYNLTNEVEVGVPADYSLSQNYPNPFNPSTKIDFELPEDAKVNLVVYDISGREVKSLMNEFRTAGYHTVNFNASNLSSGIYLYVIRANDYRMTKKMLVVK